MISLGYYIQKKAENTFFSSAHGTFSRIDHILGHKTSINKFKTTEIISSIFSDHNGMKLEINHRKRNKKKTITWRLNNMLLKNQWVNNEIKEEINQLFHFKSMVFIHLFICIDYFSPRNKIKHLIFPKPKGKET